MCNSFGRNSGKRLCQSGNLQDHSSGVKGYGWVFGNVTEVIPNSPFGELQDICNYNKCLLDPDALESNLIVVFYTQGMMKLVRISLEQETYPSEAEFKAAMIQGNLMQHIVT